MATELHDLLLRQCRVLTREQAIAAGVSRHALAHRTRPAGPWQRVLPAIFAAQTGPLTVEQRHIAALLYAGPASMLGGPSAAVTHGLRALRPNARVHLLVPHRRQPLSSGYVLARRTRRLPQPAFVGRLRTAPLERAVLVACRPMCRLDEVRALVAEAVQRGLTSPHRTGCAPTCSTAIVAPPGSLLPHWTSSRWGLGRWQRRGRGGSSPGPACRSRCGTARWSQTTVSCSPTPMPTGSTPPQFSKSTRSRTTSHLPTRTGPNDGTRG